MLQPKIKKISVVSYNPDWPNMFETEARTIKEALGDKCIAIHHVGSTSVPGLAAKPKIDIIAAVRHPSECIVALQQTSYVYKGEWNIPFQYGFSKRGTVNVNLHLFEDNHPEIELNLSFRDFLRSHPNARGEYAAIKQNLLQDPASFEKNSAMFTGYNLGKDAFIRRTLKESGFSKIRFLRCTHYKEWEKAKLFRQKYFFDLVKIDDPYTWTFNHDLHLHFVLYEGTEVIGYSHIQIWSDERVAMRIIVIDEDKRNKDFGSKFLSLIEKWLRKENYAKVHVESSREALQFYRQNGYVDLAFDDPDGYKSDPRDIPVGKLL